MAGPTSTQTTAPSDPHAAGDFSTQFANPALPPLSLGASNEAKDQYWLKHVYQGDSMRQLTLRAVVMGGVLGMLMSASNLYTTLTIGWGFGVAITSCVMSYVIWNALRALTGGALSKMSILENNCMQSTAAAAGSSTGATIATMFGALLLLAPVPEGKTAADVASWDVSPWWIVASFTFGTACLGVFLAVPMKRQMINHEGLRFPSGVAAAETLRSLYSESAESLKKAYALLGGLGAGLLVGLLNAGTTNIKFIDGPLDFIARNLFDIRLPESQPLPGTGLLERTLWSGKSAGGFYAEYSLLLVAAGVITRMRVCLSMFLGSVLLYFVVGPVLVNQDIDAAAAGSPNGWQTAADGAISWSADAVVKGTVASIELNAAGTTLLLTRWSLWGGTALMVSASLAALALNWKTVVRAFSGVSGGKDGPDPLARLEVPNSWMIVGLVPITIVLVIVQYYAFQIAWWAGLLAIAMSFVLSLVACRATGETDTTPIGAMGKVMQLLFAVVKPGAITPNLASAGVAANAASASADLLTDLKSGYLLGANPRKQFIAQFCGVFFGTLAIVPCWFLMIPSKAKLEEYQLPATRQWEAVARLLTQGLDKLPESARWAIVIGALVGVGLVLLERFTPAKHKPYLPSAMGLGLSWIIPFGNALSFLLGAIIGWIWEKGGKRHSDLYAVAIASGLIAGESLMKAILSMFATGIGLWSQFFASGAPTPTP
jgi:OPT family oligopeptide transporter